MTRSRMAAPMLVCAGLMAGCANPADVDFERGAYDPLPQLHALDYTAIEPAEAWDYWELRAAGLSAADSVIGSGGALAREELDLAVRDALDAIVRPAGFSAGCPPGDCRNYLVAVRGSAITTVTTRDRLREFLGGTTTREEAILLVAARDYVWWDDGDHTGVRDVGAGWDIVVFELTRHCQPVQTDRVRFRVHSSGAVTDEGREVWERSAESCI